MAPSNIPLGRGCSVRLFLASNLGGLLGMPNGDVLDHRRSHNANPWHAVLFLQQGTAKLKDTCSPFYLVISSMKAEVVIHRR